MQQPITRREVYEPALTATIGGRDLDVDSMSVDRELPDPLASGSLTAATVGLAVTEGADVANTVATPWDPDTQWPPAPETSAAVSMDTGSGMISILRDGRVTGADGGTSSRQINVDLADKYQSLDRTISWDAVAAHMPSLQEAENGRYVGMLTTSITDTILRECGWFSTPPRINYTMLSVPAQGTLWPERGWVTGSGRAGGGYPSWLWAQWGTCVSDVDATYDLQGGGYTIQGRGGLELCAMTQTADVAGSMYVMARSADWGARVMLWWNDSTARIRLLGTDGSYVNAVSIPRSNGLLYATLAYVNPTTLAITLRSGGRVETAEVTVPAGMTTAPLTVGHIQGVGRAAGFQIAAPNAHGTLTSWSQNAVLYPRDGNRNALEVRPPVEGENCVDLLRNQCEAEAATYWIDETGVLRWWDLARLESKTSSATLHSDDDIEESGFSWTHSLSQVKSRASVQWKQPLAQRSWRTTVDLFQGRGETLRSGDVQEGWINVPEDEVWIMPDLALGRVGDSYGDFNYGIGSWYGGVAAKTNNQDEDGWAQLDGSLLMTIERVTDNAFKTWMQWTGGSTNREATLKTLDKDSASGVGLWRRRYDFDLPIIRGKAKWTFTDRLAYSSQSGPVTAPEHQIDAGWWIQDAAQAQYTADYAGARLTVPQPVLSSVAIIPLPGLQLGDVVTVRDEHRSRLTVRGLVTADSRSINADMDMSHSVAIRPTQVSRNGVTWEEWGSVMADRTWEAWGAQQQPKTWEQWGQSPLAGEEE